MAEREGMHCPNGYTGSASSCSGMSSTAKSPPPMKVAPDGRNGGPPSGSKGMQSNGANVGAGGGFDGNGPRGRRRRGPRQRRPMNGNRSREGGSGQYSSSSPKPPHRSPSSGSANSGKAATAAASGSHPRRREKKSNKPAPSPSPHPPFTSSSSDRRHRQRNQPRNHRHNNNANNNHRHSLGRKQQPAAMTVIVNRVDLLDGVTAAKAAAAATSAVCEGTTSTSSLSSSPGAAPSQQQQHRQQNKKHHHFHVAPYHFAPDMAMWVFPSPEEEEEEVKSICVLRAPRVMGSVGPSSKKAKEKAAATSAVPPALDSTTAMNGTCASTNTNSITNAFSSSRTSSCEDYDTMDTCVPNPHPTVVHDKYWAQRRRLFSRFDRGIMLDSEGWYSVTPEVIADHVAGRVAELATSTLFRERRRQRADSEPKGIVVLDAFCGCGGNSIAFGKLPPDVVSLVVCVDVDRTKLQMAALNASLYDIPTDKLVFVESNTLHILDKCYKDGERVDGIASDSVNTVEGESRDTEEMNAGFAIGGLELLPPHIDAVFIDPPWGGVDYSMLGKSGYDLAKNMKIRQGPVASDDVQVEPPESVIPSSPIVHENVYDECTDGPCIIEDICDVKVNNNSLPPISAQAENLQQTEEEGKDFVDGVALLKMAAAATRSRLVIYDMPRNTNKVSLGQAALAAGYRGNVKLEEHYLNGRLKTVTAYFGSDHSNLLF